MPAAAARSRFAFFAARGSRRETKGNDPGKLAGVALSRGYAAVRALCHRRWEPWDVPGRARCAGVPGRTDDQGSPDRSARGNADWVLPWSSARCEHRLAAAGGLRSRGSHVPSAIACHRAVERSGLLHLAAGHERNPPTRRGDQRADAIRHWNALPVLWGMGWSRQPLHTRQVAADPVAYRRVGTRHTFFLGW